MFKVIRDFVPNTQFLIMCDRACGQFSITNVPPAPQEALDASQAMWANSLVQAGWKITLSEHVCPAHVKQDREGKSLIIMPTLAAGGRN